MAVSDLAFDSSVQFTCSVYLRPIEVPLIVVSILEKSNFSFGNNFEFSRMLTFLNGTSIGRKKTVKTKNSKIKTLNQSNAQSETAMSKQVGFSVGKLKLKFGSR